MGENLIALSPSVLGHCPVERWRTRFRHDIWQSATVV